MSEIWAAGAGEGGLLRTQSGFGDMTTQWAETSMAGGKHQSAPRERRAPQTPLARILSSVLILLLARNVWAWITVFGTSRVQSGLRLDRQLETESTGCQHSGEEGEETQQKMFPSNLR